MLVMFGVWLLDRLLRNLNWSHLCNLPWVIVLHPALLCGRKYLNPAWKVALAFVADIILETGSEAVLAVENDLVRNLHHKEAPFWGCHINPPDHTLGKALHRTGWMEVNANLIPDLNLYR